MCNLYAVGLAIRSAGKHAQLTVAGDHCPNSWVDRVIAECGFKDERLGKRFAALHHGLRDSDAFESGA